MPAAMKVSLIRANAIAIALWTILLSTPSFATTKGLNQIVTPDIQPVGELSISFQGENRAIGNPEQLQLELGITRYFEVALFQGFSPVESVLAFELGLVTKKPVLVSAGMLGLQNGAKAQPFLEGGYYRGKTILIAGVQGQNSAVYGIFGAAYQATQRLLLAADYISGSPNFATLGVTYAITPNLSLNPAVYISNSTPHHAYGYAVLTWNVKAW